MVRALGIIPVEVIYAGPYEEKFIKTLHQNLDFEKNEGYVMRLRDGFSYGEFRKYVGKFVRPDHIKTTKHWMHGQEMEVNSIKEVQHG